MALLQQRIAGFVRDTAVTADVWQEVAPDYVALAVEKARASMVRTMTELSQRAAGSFTLLAVNNDRLPVLELLALSLNPAVRIPREGEVMEMRFEGQADSGNGDVRLLYAAHGAVM